MKQKVYEQLNKKIYYDTLTNGLKVFIIPKPHFNKTFLSLDVNYGSIDNTLIPADGSDSISLPAGVAHFLEHKMFDKKTYDVDSLFNHYGAEVNAFTSFTDTNYVAETTQNLKQVLNLLLNFVQIPYFDAAKVDKEKGIIEQEIKMYDDDPDALLYFKTVRNMYPHFALNQDVAGSVDSIQKITVNDLYLAHNNFYRPANMKLVIVGDVNPTEIISMIKQNQSKLDLKSFNAGKAFFDLNDLRGINRLEKTNLGLAQPKAALGIKGLNSMGNDQENLKNELTLELLMYILLSSHSTLNAQMYRNGIIDDSFNYEIENERLFHFAFISGDTDYPDEFITQLKHTLLNAGQGLVGRNNELQLIKREMIGSRIMQDDSVERLALSVGDKFNGYSNLYDEIQIIERIELMDLIDMANSFFKLDNMTVNIIK